MSSVSSITIQTSTLLWMQAQAGLPATDGNDSSPPQSSAPKSSAPGDQGAAVVISLSVEAQRIMAAPASAASNPYVKFFPTRDGSPATALAAAVSDPGSVSSSAGKSFDQVAADARARMDAKYAAMKASGQPFDPNSFEGRDWHTLMGDLDRRSLYAVASNAGGLFSKDEQDIAKSIMGQQQGLAMGLYSGPISQEGQFVDPFAGDNAGHMKAGMRFLDAVSPEEKGSFDWATQRAGTQFSYELTMRRDGQEPENVDSGSPLVRMIKSAMDAWKELNDPSKRLEDMPQYQQWKPITQAGKAPPARSM